MRRIASIPMVLALSMSPELPGGITPDAARLARASEGPAADAAPLKLGEERPPAGEAEVIKELVVTQVGIMKATAPTKRGQHLKGHGCVEAEFVVRDDIPPPHRIGLFKEPRSYQARIRFSNGSQVDDPQPDVHGMAVKVLGVAGPRALAEYAREEQDFVLVDSEVFFAPDAKTVLELMKATVAAKQQPAEMQAFAASHPRVMELLRAGRKTIASPLATRYWSTVPFALGDSAVKYMAVPAAGNGPAGEAKAIGEHYLREAMVARLSEGQSPVTFDLCIIPQTDPVAMPVEDPTIRWASEPIPVARITIRPQTFDTPERQRECEAAVFDPWHALADHRPLGGVNRARRAVYPASAEARHANR